MAHSKPEKISLNDVLLLVDQLPADEREQLRQRLNAEPHPFFDWKIDIDSLAAQQGVPESVSLKNLMGNFWPKDEGFGEFETTLRRWRQESSGR